MKTARRIGCSCLLLVLAARPAPVQEDAPSPFAGVETRVLDNRLKIWFKRTPGQRVAALSVTVPAGMDQDPPGREELAHYLEHLQFVGHLAVGSPEVKRQIEDRGGEIAFSTHTDHTVYAVRIAPEHGLFALDWLCRGLSPHGLEPQAMERERQPVEVERGARPRQILDWLRWAYLNPVWLRPPEFWEREFGLSTVDRRDYYPYRSLRAITTSDLAAFYGRYYRPDRLTLTVIGDLDRGAVMGAAEGTCGRLRPAGEPPPLPTIRDGGRSHATFLWALVGSDVFYSRRFRLGNLSARDHVTALFLEPFMFKRLNDRLRYGERVAAYTMFASVTTRGPASSFDIEGKIRPTEYAFARTSIDALLHDLQNGTIPPAEFDRLRATVVQQLRNSTTTPVDLEQWASKRFFDRQRHEGFPDLIAAFQALRQDDIAAFAQRHLIPEREVLWVERVLPFSQGAAILLAIGVAFGTVSLLRRRLVRQVDLTCLRYVARFRIPLPMRIIGAGLWLMLTAAALRALVYAYTLVATRFLLAIDSFAVQFCAFALMFGSLVAVVVLALSRVPRKLLVFDDRLLIKYLAYRSTPVPLGEIEELSLARFRTMWPTRRAWNCTLLLVGAIGPGIYLRRRGGRGYFFDVRDRDECLGVLRSLIGAAGTA